MLKQKTYLSGISVLLITAGVFLSAGLSPENSRAETSGAACGNFPGSSIPADIAPEIHENLQRNNFQAVSFKTAAPDFVLRDLEGAPVSLSQFKGEVVLLGFFTTR